MSDVSRVFDSQMAWTDAFCPKFAPRQGEAIPWKTLGVATLKKWRNGSRFQKPLEPIGLFGIVPDKT